MTTGPQLWRSRSESYFPHDDLDSFLQELPSNAFGQLDFEGNSSVKAAKYVRLADNTTIASVKEFIVEHWGLLRPRPHLVLSIVGGAKNFHMDGRKKETFKAGLIGAARATNAWVLSGGTNTGVMKLVGEELEEGRRKAVP